MNTSKKIAIAVLVSAVLPALTLAQVGGSPPTNLSLDLTGLGQLIVNAVWIVFTILAIIAFIYAAILFLTSGGNPEKVSAARMAFMWGVVGIIVGILAYTIVNLVRLTLHA